MINNTNSIIEISSDSDLGAFLANALSLQTQANSTQWKTEILQKSPMVAPYLIAGIQSQNFIENSHIIVDCPDLRDASRKSLQVSWDIVLREIGSIVVLICATGGSKAFIDLIKTWVEERSSRKIRIKKGDIELEIQGGISERKLKEIIDLFEKKFGESKILLP